MISYVCGTIEMKGENFLIVNVNGVGYRVFCAPAVLEKTKNKKGEIELFTTLFVREDRIELYGFEKPQELEFFETLLTVSGIGPRAAQNILGAGPVTKLKKAIEEGDEKMFSRIPGVGHKKIKKIILELSGKLVRDVERMRDDLPQFSDAHKALRRLGFRAQEIRETFDEIPNDLKDSKEIVTQALKLLGKPR